MPESVDQFPNSLTLNGADYFCLQLDALMWQSSAKRNVCTFVVALAEPISLKELQQHLSQRPVYQWLCRLRLRQGLPFSLAKWVFYPNATLPTLAEYPLANGDLLPSKLLSTPLDIKRQSAFNIAVLQLSGAGSILVFTWHHVLMDARGGEAFIRQLGMPQPLNPVEFIAATDVPLPLKTRANIALKMKQFLYDTSHLPILALNKPSKSQPQAHYRVISFTAAQSQVIIGRARQLDAGFLLSAFYLAATTYAIAQLQQQRSLAHDDVLVPVPLDRRKRGSQGAILSNQVSFLFYRIPSAKLTDLSACTAELITQMKNLMRSESPEHYTIMMDFLRRIPGGLYRRMLKAPTQGLMASFFYSDTGDTLPDVETLFARRINSAVHYPPNTYPPGITFVFSRFQGALQITLGYMTPDLKATEVEQLCTHLRTALLG